MKKPTTKLLKPSLPSYIGEGCQFEVYDKTSNSMTVCGALEHNIGKIVYCVCTEHYDYLVALGKKVKLKGKKK